MDEVGGEVGAEGDSLQEGAFSRREEEAEKTLVSSTHFKQQLQE